MTNQQKIQLQTLYKPDGTEMKVNKDSLDHALKLGWTEDDPTKKKAK